MTISPQHNALNIGNIIGNKYRIEKLLGQGGMGQVYLVTHIQLDKHFALKVMLLGDDQDSKHLLRFNREAKVLAKLSHPNIVMIADFGVTPDSKLPYIVMEYIKGTSLRNILRMNGTLSETTVVNIGKQICAGLSIAHKNGIVHRDLKPENIMVEKLLDDQIIVRILDFGIAKITIQNQEITSENKNLTEGNIIGTKQYMSPEQIFGSKIDEGSDIYSLSVMLYEMLTGVIPSAVFGNIKPLTVMRIGTSPKLSKIIEKGLSFQRNERQQDILELKTQLESFNTDFEPTKINDIPKLILAEKQTSPPPLITEITIKKVPINENKIAVKENTSANKPNTYYLPQYIANSISRPKNQRYLAFSIIAVIGFLAIVIPICFYDKLPGHSIAVETKSINEESFQMIIIPSNNFTMGDDKGDIYCKPTHNVQVSSFEVSRFLVTNNQYIEFIKNTNYPYPKEWNGIMPDKTLLEKPIVNISWNDANNYCNWLGKQTGKNYRLLYEKEWEYIARYKNKFRVEEILADYVEWTGTTLELYPGAKVELPEILKTTSPRIIRGKDEKLLADDFVTYRQWQVSDFRHDKLSFRIACDIKIK